MDSGKLPADFLAADDGNLYRSPDYARPVRVNYRRHHRTIQTVAELKATLRAGPYAWPGGYAVFFVASDGAALSFAAVRDNFRQCAESIRGRLRDGWQIVAAGTTAELEEAELCAHTGQPIE
jgi:hypothetical protein